MRDITGKAGVALALANYHFGTKLNLLFTLVAERMRPINDQRQELLEALERDYADRPGELPVEAVLHAIMDPFLRAHRQHRTAMTVSLLSLRVKEAHDFWERMWKEHFQKLHEVTLRTLRLAMPQLSMDSIYWNLHFVLGLLFSVAADPKRLHYVSVGQVDQDYDELLSRLVSFCAAGFRASVEHKT